MKTTVKGVPILVATVSTL